MSTASIRLPDDLQSCIAKTAKCADISTHACIVAAITEKTDRSERADAFHRDADARYASVLASGEAVPWPEMRAYLQARVRGQSAARPASRKTSR